MADLQWWKEHAKALDRNWEAVHSAAMTPIRAALGLPDGSVPDLVAAIEGLRDEIERLKAAPPHPEGGPIFQ